ncbi:alpha/beta hydrolase [Streptomyces litchfieldiae]|uniref:Alpha/beta hydrolase n=1 Tax=Streptomyces litchfieldiae TaxID=3075543 RepID=A0ABU2MT94_9ACTN|nr:alpha/beta hydrolase [Streptomyces sp. DSM 44938]MDT0344856.1 alpha/beta hydrolase [Streptomyces sp. DSM 44938]
MRRRTTAAVAATTLLSAGAVVAAVAAGRWAYDAARVRRPPGFAGARLSVHSTAAGQVTLTRSLHSLRRGTYGLAGKSCHAVVGPPLEVRAGPDSVVRRLERVDHGELTPGAPVTLTPQLHLGTPESALGITHTDVSIPAPDGPLPAWFIPGSRDTWVIALHGFGATREHPLNIVPFLHDQHLPVLIPAHRGAWRDADAALGYALGYGARCVVLYGWSTGAAMALRAAAHSEARDRVAGLVLDSPVLDPAATLRALAARRGVPGPLLPLVTGGRPQKAAEPPPAPPPPGESGAPVPVLVLHGPGDTVAPWDASRDLAARHPESVTLHVIADAEHAAMWNADPPAYEERLRRFLTPLM